MNREDVVVIIGIIILICISAFIVHHHVKQDFCKYNVDDTLISADNYIQYKRFLEQDTRPINISENTDCNKYNKKDNTT